MIVRLQLYSKLISFGSGCSLSLSWATLWALCGLKTTRLLATQRGGFADCWAGETGRMEEEQGRRDEHWEKSRDLEICQHRGLVHCSLHASRPQATDLEELPCTKWNGWVKWVGVCGEWLPFPFSWTLVKKKIRNRGWCRGHVAWTRGTRSWRGGSCSMQQLV